MLLLECNTSDHHELSVATAGMQSSYTVHRYASLLECITLGYYAALNPELPD